MSKGAGGALIARLGSYVVFPVSAFVKALRDDDEQILVATTNPFYLPALLVLGRPLHKKRVVALIWDLFPEAAITAGMIGERSLVARLVRGVNRRMLCGADGVVFIGEHMQKYISDKYGVPRASAVIETGAIDEEFSKVDTTKPPEGSEPERGKSLALFCEGKTILSYVGNMGHVHETETLIEALLPLVHRAQGWALVVCASGPGVAKFRRAFSEVDPKVVRFEEPLLDHEWAWLMARTDVSFVTLKDAARHTSIPSKTFSAMAANSAVVAVAPRGSDLFLLLKRYGCGEVFEPGDAAGVRGLVAQLLSSEEFLAERKNAARRALLEHFEMSVVARKWSQFLRTVSAQTPAR
jgi:glycosyltransferase involved in cell wall biosynthesis